MAHRIAKERGQCNPVICQRTADVVNRKEVIPRQDGIAKYGQCQGEEQLTGGNLFQEGYDVVLMIVGEFSVEDSDGKGKKEQPNRWADLMHPSSLHTTRAS